MPSYNNYLRRIVFFVMVSLVVNMAPTALAAKTAANQRIVPSAKIVANNIIDRSFYRDLPVGSVDIFSVKKPIGTAIYLPQYHREPGSLVEDKINDRAVMVQMEHYEIINKISEVSPNISILVEGEYVGAVSRQKIQYLNNLSRVSTKSSEREFILAGAPLKLAAVGGKVKLFGAELPATALVADAIVQKYFTLASQMQLMRGLVNVGNHTNAKITSKETQIKFAMQAVNAEINDVIVNQRNQEAANAFLEMLRKISKASVSFNLALAIRRG